VKKASLVPPAEILNPYFQIPVGGDWPSFQVQSGVQSEFFLWQGLQLFGEHVGESHESLCSGNIAFDPRVAVQHLHYESYIPKDTKTALRGKQSLSRKLYYAVRPLLPVAVRKHLQRVFLSDWSAIQFPQWPVDDTADALLREILKALLLTSGEEKIPFIWFWPEGKQGCVLHTHDVETKIGLRDCPELMELDRGFGFRAAYQLIPEKRYQVQPEHLQSFRAQDCEVNLHGLNHDGNLFRDFATFSGRRDAILKYKAEFGARGFRSPAFYRDLDWIAELGFEYDMSVPNVGHMEAQRGGCATTFPYFFGNTLEIPLTTVQDYSLFHILREDSIDLWKAQMNAILRWNGMVCFNTHPDYLRANHERTIYSNLLEEVAKRVDSQNLWTPLPGELNDWWRLRNNMQLQPEADGWRISGEGAARARVAFASLEEGDLAFSLE
jgi:hypothetical protein